MLEELLPTGLTETARRLGVEPFEVVRLMVATDTVSERFSATDDHLQKLMSFGEIESGWWEGAELPDDANPLRKRVRAAIGLLLGRAAGGTAIRMDNLWRGLGLADQVVVEEALNILADEELVVIENTDSGVKISYTAAAEEVLRELASGKSDVEALTEVYQG